MANRPNDGLNAVKRYQAKCDAITIRPLKAEGEQIRASANAEGISVTQFILKAIHEYYANHSESEEK